MSTGHASVRHPNTGTVDTVCGYCGVGCGITLTVDDDRVTGVRGTPDHPANGGRLCTKGKTTAELLGAPGRLDRAWHRADRSAPPSPLPMADAITETARGLARARADHGPGAVALYVSGQMSIEAQYLANKLAKGFLGAHIESNSRLCMASAAAGYKLAFGSDAPPGSYDDIDHADAFLVLGSNTADCHPVLYLRMLDRIRDGARMIVVDPRRTATAEKADLHLPVRPGTDLALLNGLLRLLVDRGAVDERFVAEHTEGWAAMAPLLAASDPESVAAVTGLAVDDLHRAADLLAGADAWMSLWTMGLNQSTHGTANTLAVCNLHLATGTVGRPGCGPFSLTGQPNAMGGRDMGYLGPGLPGQRTVDDPDDRAFAEHVWGLEPGTLAALAPPERIAGTVELFSAMTAGEVRAAWIICTNPAASMANRSRVAEALCAADFVAVQEVFDGTETARFADVTLPAALWAECDGVFVNSERTLTLARAAVPPPGDARPDWRLICDVAAALGHPDAFDYPDSAAVFAELTRFTNERTGWDVSGVDHARLASGPVQWPAAPGGPARNPIRYLNDGAHGPVFTDGDGRTPRLAFATPSRRARFHARAHGPTAEPVDGSFPLVLTTGRLPNQWHTMTKTGRVDALARLDPAPFVEVAPADAASIGIADGDWVAITSRRGRAVAPARVTEAIVAGTCFAPMHFGDSFAAGVAINTVTSDAVDPVSRQPELKACAVALAPCPADEVPRLPTPRVRETAAQVAADDAALTVVWASQTGTVEDFAAGLARDVTAAGLPTRSVRADRVDPASLSGTVVFTVSTTGDGDSPDNGVALWDALATASASDLADVRFAVLGFGDSSYADFCGFARKLDGRLAQLGATRLVDRVSCEPDFHDTASAWRTRMIELLGGDVAAVRPEVPAAVGTRRNPLTATLVANDLLSAPGSDKEVRRFAFDVGTLEYAVGDALGVLPRNRPDAVDEWLLRTGTDASAPVRVAGIDTTLREALTTRLDLSAVSADLVRFVADRGGPPELRRCADHPSRLSELSHGRWAADVPGIDRVAATAQEWADVLRPLHPRMYSISSSPLASPGRIETTVSTVRYDGVGHDGRPARRHGVCSAFLADSAVGTAVEVFVRPNAAFGPPADPDSPAVMIGPGTGVAPFRGFLHDRATSGAGGDNWLFFGERRSHDFYYREELDRMRAAGVLTRLDTAFSRDQPHKVYVQDLMRESAAELWSWLGRGAHVYVCGDAARMAHDVDAALREIVATQGRLDAAGADAFVAALAADGRYVRDVY